MLKARNGCFHPLFHQLLLPRYDIATVRRRCLSMTPSTTYYVSVFMNVSAFCKISMIKHPLRANKENNRSIQCVLKMSLFRSTHTTMNDKIKEFKLPFQAEQNSLKSIWNWMKTVLPSIWYVLLLHMQQGIIHKQWSSKFPISFSLPYFAEKSKFCSKIQILLKNPNFVEKSKFCWKIQILLKNPNFVENPNFVQNTYGEKI